MINFNIEPLKDPIYEKCNGKECDCIIEATEFKPYICPVCGRIITPCNICSKFNIRSTFFIDKCNKECPIIEECNKSPESIEKYSKEYKRCLEQNRVCNEEYGYIQNILNS